MPMQVPNFSSYSHRCMSAKAVEPIRAQPTNQPPTVFEMVLVVAWADEQSYAPVSVDLRRCRRTFMVQKLTFLIAKFCSPALSVSTIHVLAANRWLF